MYCWIQLKKKKKDCLCGEVGLTLVQSRNSYISASTLFFNQ